MLKLLMLALTQAIPPEVHEKGLEMILWRETVGWWYLFMQTGEMCRI